MDKKVSEWLKQADYDFDTAKYMLSGGRYFYAVFMAHLSIEKALKGLYQYKLKETPPKTHNLLYLLNKLDVNPEKNMGKFIARLNEANIATRYPEDMDVLSRNYTEEITKRIVSQTEETLRWIKGMF